MRKIYKISEEEFEAIKDAVVDVLDLWHYDFVEVSNKNRASLSMSKGEFFKALKEQFVIKT